MMARDLTWLEEAGLDTATGIGYTGGEGKYLSALQRFLKNHDKNRTRVEETRAAGDLENYMITVHALKSNARMIGAAALADSFAALEEAARNRDKAAVDAGTAPAIAAYDALTGKLSPLAEMDEVRAADEITAEEARETAEQLLQALDDFDDELSGELVKRLSGYPFRITQRDRLREAAAFVEDFLYDEAAQIIREIIPAIE